MAKPRRRKGTSPEAAGAWIFLAAGIVVVVVIWKAILGAVAVVGAVIVVAVALDIVMWFRGRRGLRFTRRAFALLRGRPREAFARLVEFPALADVDDDIDRADPDEPLAQRVLVLESHEQWHDLVVLTNNAPQDTWQAPSILLSRAGALAHLGSTDAALAAYGECLRSRYSSSALAIEIYYRRGKLFKDVGRRSQARRDLARVQAVDSNYRDVAELIADLTVARPTAGREHIPREVRDRVWQRDLGQCVECGSRERLEFDHIVAVVNGGSNTERNLRLLCEPCNRAKGAGI